MANQASPQSAWSCPPTGGKVAVLNRHQQAASRAKRQTNIDQKRKISLTQVSVGTLVGSVGELRRPSVIRRGIGLPLLTVAGGRAILAKPCPMCGPWARVDLSQGRLQNVTPAGSQCPWADESAETGDSVEGLDSAAPSSIRVRRRFRALPITLISDSAMQPAAINGFR